MGHVIRAPSETQTSLTKRTDPEKKALTKGPDTTRLARIAAPHALHHAWLPMPFSILATLFAL